MPFSEDTLFNGYIEKARQLLKKSYGDGAKAYVRSYGCLQNVSDGEKIMGTLAEIGFLKTDNPSESDIIIYNTCAVRENAEDKIYGDIGELKHLKEKNPNLIIGLCGCMTQQEHIADKIKASYPQIDILFGTHAIAHLPKLVFETMKAGKRHYDINEYQEPLDGVPILRDNICNKANLPIMYGCDNFCSYCVVPYVRGRERSRTSRSIKNEFNSLISEGYKEIMLLGQNVNSYGKGLDEKTDFSSLLKELNSVEGDFRIRFMSSHPKDAKRELIDTIASCDKVCNHFHLPVQSGSDRILKLMNRHYTTESYISFVDYAVKTIPDIAFTTDIIVGFPGETDEDIEATAQLLRRVRFDSVFMFIYSKRIGTKAAEMEDNVPYSVKSERFKRLLAIQKEIGREKYGQSVGRVMRVLAEGICEENPELLCGKSDNYSIVHFKGDKKLIGEFVNVKIKASLGWALEGEII